MSKTSQRGDFQHTLATGYGAGHKTIPNLVNCCRVRLASTSDTNRSEQSTEQPSQQDQIAELIAVIDDASGEDLAAAMPQLFAAGAVDAYYSPTVMKKGRPGWQLTVLCPPTLLQDISDAVLSHTSAIGHRQRICQRQILPRRMGDIRLTGPDNKDYSVRGKIVMLPDGSERVKPEDDDVQHLRKDLEYPGINHSPASACCLERTTHCSRRG